MLPCVSSIGESVTRYMWSRVTFRLFGYAPGCIATKVIRRPVARPECGAYQISFSPYGNYHLKGSNLQADWYQGDKQIDKINLLINKFFIYEEVICQ